MMVALSLLLSTNHNFKHFMHSTVTESSNDKYQIPSLNKCSQILTLLPSKRNVLIHCVIIFLFSRGEEAPERDEVSSKKGDAERGGAGAHPFRTPLYRSRYVRWPRPTSKPSGAKSAPDGPRGAPQ